MINNTLKTAKFRLNQHRVQGKDSKLNIFEVAALMDVIKKSEQLGKEKGSNLFHQMSLN